MKLMKRERLNINLCGFSVKLTRKMCCVMFELGVCVKNSPLNDKENVKLFNEVCVMCLTLSS